MKTYGGPLVVPRRFFVAASTATRTGPTDLFGQERRFEAGIVGSGAAVDLRAIHVDHAHVLARHVEELRDAGAQAVRLHVVRIDRHLPVGRVRQRVRRADGRVSLEGHFVFGFDHSLGTREGRGRIALNIALRSADVGVARRM